MFCSHCGASLDADYKFCPACGSPLDSPTLSATPPDLTTPPPSEPEPPAIISKRPMPLWFKLLILLAVLALIGVTAGILFTESLVDVVDHQLEALRHNDIHKAYSVYTSKDFQTTTSLDQFRHFVYTYPVFLNNESAHFTQRSIEHQIGTLKGNLISKDRVETPIEYKLIKEDGKWKILSIRLLKPENIQQAKGEHIEDLIQIVKDQLREIQEGKLIDAYQNYSSKEFKEATSEDTFQEFIRRYPILANYHTVSFHKPVIRDGIGTLSVILQSKQMMAAYLKYYLIYEDQKWKIWSMRILSPSEEMEEKKKEDSQLLELV